MPDNSENDVIETLIKYIDGELNATEKEAMEKLLEQNKDLRERYQYLLAIKCAIRSGKLKERVQAIHAEYVQDAQPKETGVVREINQTSFSKIFMRVAAVLFIAVAGFAVFQYTATSNQSVYDSNMIAYTLPVNRNNEKPDALNALYNSGNYKGVIKSFDAIQGKTQQDFFIAAQAYLQLNDVDNAINAFQQVESINKYKTEKYFTQETDYYLMLAYIKKGEIGLAEQQLNKITSNKQHLYYNKASDISRTKLQILKWKNKQ